MLERLAEIERRFEELERLVTDPAVFLQAMAVSLLAALAACVYPLLRLGRMEIATALRQE